MKNKKILLIGSIILIIVSIISIILILTNNKDNPTTNNDLIEGIELVENKDILKDSVVDNLTVTNISLLTRDGISQYKATLLNETNKDIKINKLYVVFYENELSTETLAIKDVTIKPNTKKYINITSQTDLTKTTKIEYVLED